MRLLHLSDLHLGKRVNEFSMLADQKYILEQILGIVDEEKPDGILIAGDIFDKAVPGEDAIRLWDDFLKKLVQRKQQVFAISGNHDSAVRLSSHGELIDATGVHLAPVYAGTVKPIPLVDVHGTVNIYMLPFLKPVAVRGCFPEEDIQDYTDACRVAISRMELSENERNVLLAHQYVAGGSLCESEEISIGGLDQVDVSVFDKFDYVALGHLHGPQHVGRESVRYSGTPLKYSFSEAAHKKSVTIVELGQKGELTIRTIALVPMRDMRQIKGTYLELTDKSNYEKLPRTDYIHAVLTDEDDILEAFQRLRVIYPNLMKLTYDNKRTGENRIPDGVADVENKTPLELFEEFYEVQNNQPMSREQRELALAVIRSVWEV